MIEARMWSLGADPVGVYHAFSEYVDMTALMGVSWQNKDADHRTCPWNMVPASSLCEYIMFMVLCFCRDTFTKGSPGIEGF